MKFIDLARQMEAFFIQKRFLLSALKPELVLKEENLDLRFEISRKDELIKKHYERIEYWKNMLSDQQQQHTQHPPNQPPPPPQVTFDIYSSCKSIKKLNRFLLYFRWDPVECQPIWETCQWDRDQDQDRWECLNKAVVDQCRCLQCHQQCRYSPNFTIIESKLKMIDGIYVKLYEIWDTIF